MSNTFASRFWSTCPLVAGEACTVKSVASKLQANCKQIASKLQANVCQDGFAGYSVSYKGEMTQFSATEVRA